MYLNEIIKNKKEEVKTMKIPDKSRTRPVKNPLEYLPGRPFIAEIKKASPSRGEINFDNDITTRAVAYQNGGAGAVSVLTDNRYFKGSFEYLADIAQKVSIPVLCKDFILSEIQIENAYIHGADFILLIAAILNVREMRILAKRAERYSMMVLYEIHDADEFTIIKHLSPELVGVNSRNLDTLAIDKEKAIATLQSLPGGFLRVAESGIESPEDIKDFQHAGADAFLIGTTLMIAENPAERIKEFYRALEAPCS